MPAPAAPGLTLVSPKAVRADLLGIAGEIRVEGLEPGATWTYSLDGGKTWHPGAGTALAPAALGADGAKSLLVAQVNAQGGRSAESPLRFDLDTVAPGEPGVSLVSDTGVSASDGVTRDGTLRIDGLEPGARWSFSVDGGTTWPEGVGSTIEARHLGADGAKEIWVRQTDDAGNEGPVARLPVVLDRVALAPVATLTRDTGASATDGVTSEARVSVTGLEAGATWKYSLDGVTWTEGQGDSIPSAAFGADGLKRVWVQQTDRAGNVSATQPLDFTLDRSAEAPTATLRSPARDHFAAKLPDGSDFYVSNRVNDDTWIQLGLAPGATWSCSVDGKAYATGSGDRLNLAALADGAHELKIRQQDLAGNWSGDTVLNLTMENQAPTVSGLWTHDRTNREMYWRLQTDEQVQVAVIPVGTPNTGSAESYLDVGRAAMTQLVVPGQDAKAHVLTLPSDMYMVVAIDQAGNAAFASMRGESTPAGLSANAIEATKQSSPPNMQIAHAAFNAGLTAWTATSSLDTDHLYGSVNADRFIWQQLSSRGGMDWVHGYDKRQGDVLEIGGLRANPNDTSPAQLARFFRKEVLADGTVSLWIDKDGLGQTYPGDDRTLFDQRILVSSDSGPDLTIRLSQTGATFVL